MQWQRRQARGAPPAAAAGGGGGGGGHKDVLDAAAQEVFRVALFAVFFLQVSAVAFVPVLGAPRARGRWGRPPVGGAGQHSCVLLDGILQQLCPLKSDIALLHTIVW